ncbi:adenosylcobinamide-GDP ribazoletransferase [Massiliimalia massiliensis]|jgi:adenosylcobinamide-GDP ribazoletransferase|uniref:adenosylcobinamide-GDP ribazoletransferase n=1 Tax=Massiliimalia massiliensis TaxID=1852384 RepID=UPI0009847F19|nr:adenosylcobinamide-GDP ribazoletransferase [Massiliimalia massiliensis]
MRLWESFKIAFAMYSVLPIPDVKWEEKNMRYAFCFFPLIGLVVGGALSLWLWLSHLLELGGLLTAVVAVSVPILLTGGIHLDGFCDTSDALASRQPPERKLEILKDSHVGAFAVIAVGIYLLLTAGLWEEYRFTVSSMGVLWCGFVLSRALSGWSSVSFPPSKNSGLLRSFSDAAQKQAVRLSSVLFILLSLAGMVLFDWIAAVCVAVLVFLLLFFYYWMAKRQFGGVSGDLAGYFLTLCEWVVLLGVVVAQGVERLAV